MSSIELRRPLSRATVVALLGEIFTRRKYFPCRDLVERQAKRSIIVKRAPVFEYRIESLRLQVERLHTHLTSATINPRSADHA